MAINVKPSQLAELISQAIECREPLLIVGPPGCGKTALVKSGVQSAGADLVLRHPAIEDVTDSKGLPHFGADGATWEAFGDHKLLLNAARPTVCFIDDFGQARESVQAGYMQWLHGGNLGGRQISPEVRFILATNRRGDKAGVQGVLEPVKSRTTIVNLVSDYTDWVTMFAAPAQISPVIIAFLAFRPELLSKFTPSADMENCPSERNWETVSHWLARDMSKHLTHATVAGRVGEPTADQFIAFQRIWADMVSPHLVLSSPDTAPIPTELSALWALVTAIADLVKVPSMPRFCTYMQRLYDANKREFLALSTKIATARDPSLASTPAYVQMMTGPIGKLFIG